MSDTAEDTRTPVFYLRIPSALLVRKNNLTVCLPEAFIPRKSQPGGLSVFHSDYAIPRDVLEHLIKTLPVKRREEWGETPEGIVASGWRIAELTRSAFPEHDFNLMEPEPNGHVNVKARAGEGQNVEPAITIFRQYSLEWSETARVLSETQCLQRSISKASQ